MSAKMMTLIAVLAALFLLPNCTLGIKPEGYEYVLEKKDFFLEDLKHDSTIVGGWCETDYVLTLKINSPDYQLDLEVVLNDKERLGNIKIMEMDKSYLYEGGKVFNIGPCAAKKTQPLWTNGTCKPRPPGMISKASNFCKTCAVAVFNVWMNGPKVLSNALDSVYIGVIWLVSKSYSGLTFAIDWTRTEGILLTYKAYDGIIVAKEWSWVQVKWLVWNAFYALMWTFYWTFYIAWWIGSGIWVQIEWIGSGIWVQIEWIGSAIWVQIEWIGDAVNFYYYFYLESKVTYAKAIADSVPRIYVLIFVSTIVNVVCSFKWINWAVEKYRLRRQARLEREAAERAAAASASSSRRRRKGPNQNKKNKKKKEDIFWIY
ncbi:uncharacterized protein LOC122958463 [Acropora millepora]|uniref:uncharacterized protein LOC122958463 n=1 Tax=Acropora millepora TaxID=45264 RepID=UPI001CF562A3|nr:uncharacterized protein LOC122958463 [Acropora millepora]